MLSAKRLQIGLGENESRQGKSVYLINILGEIRLFSCSFLASSCPPPTHTVVELGR